MRKEKKIASKMFVLVVGISDTNIRVLKPQIYKAITAVVVQYFAKVNGM